jgi:hypothetical protein
LFKGKDQVWREEAIVRPQIDLKYRYHEGCQKCSARSICDGFHGDYADLFGTDEATPIVDVAPTQDPCCFIKEQDKVVEPEDKGWAL